MTTSLADELSPSEQRRANRLASFARKARRELNLTPVAQAVNSALPQIITFEDLDGDQLKAYLGIHNWWNTQRGIGGVAQPLTVGGYAGTGKSTLLSIALPALRDPTGASPRVVYCAYTGKAANVLMQKGMDAQTIHSLIYDASPDPDDRDRVIFILKLRDEIEADLIVVDEASMVPDDMRLDLESLGIALLYTGDHGQLPPVSGEGNVMADPHFRLEIVHRQALNSGIILLATAVRQREMTSMGVHGVKRDAQKVGRRFINDTKLLAAADVVICFTNAMRASLNSRLREYKGYHGTYPEVGERLICIRNNKVTRMFNGLIVTILAVRYEVGFIIMDVVDDSGKKYLEIKAYNNYFEGEEHPKIYGQTLFDLFEFAYAITGHKSQGSQWDNVVVIEEAMTRQTQDIRRRWMYTALTRAAKYLTWVSKFS